jgi:hypothetical protein
MKACSVLLAAMLVLCARVQAVSITQLTKRLFGRFRIGPHLSGTGFRRMHLSWTRVLLEMHHLTYRWFRDARGLDPVSGPRDGRRLDPAVLSCRHHRHRDPNGRVLADPEEMDNYCRATTGR